MAELLLQRMERDLFVGEKFHGMRVPQAMRMHALVDAGFPRPSLEHVADIGLRGDWVALEGAEERGGAPVEAEPIFRAQPAVDEAEGRGVEADRARLMAFAVVYSDCAALAVEVARMERQGLPDSQAACDTAPRSGTHPGYPWGRAPSIGR